MAALSEPEAVAHAVAGVFGLSFQGARPVDALVDALSRHQALLVVDNCEHVKAAAAELVGRLMVAAPGVRLLATSREPLGVQGEQVWPVRPLALGSDSVELFCDRAALSDPAFELDDTGRVLVERICV